MNDGKHPLKSKTLWLNGLTLLITAITAVAASPFVAENPKLVLWLGSVVSGLNIILRLLTTGPIQLPEQGMG